MIPLAIIFSALSILCTGIALGSCMKVDDMPESDAEIHYGPWIV